MLLFNNLNLKKNICIVNILTCVCIGNGYFPYWDLWEHGGKKLSKGEGHQCAPVVAAREGRLGAHAAERERGRAERHHRQQLHHRHRQRERELGHRQLAHYVAGRAERVPGNAQRHHSRGLASPTRVPHLYYFLLAFNYYFSITILLVSSA